MQSNSSFLNRFSPCYAFGKAFFIELESLHGRTMLFVVVVAVVVATCLQENERGGNAFSITQYFPSLISYISYCSMVL